MCLANTKITYELNVFRAILCFCIRFQRTTQRTRRRVESSLLVLPFEDDAHSDSQMSLADAVEFVRVVVAAPATKADSHLLVALVKNKSDLYTNAFCTGAKRSVILDMS
jgi:hypothetical protein